MDTQQQTVTVPQWKDALDKGNRVRLGRAEYKRKMKSGEHTSRDLLLDTPALALDVPIEEALQWIPGIKRVRAQRIMRGIVYSGGVPLRRLSPATRAKLYAQVEHYRPTYTHGAV
jgi:hypothetical protein